MKESLNSSQLICIMISGLQQVEMRETEVDKCRPELLHQGVPFLKRIKTYVKVF